MVPEEGSGQRVRTPGGSGGDGGPVPVTLPPVRLVLVMPLQLLLLLVSFVPRSTPQANTPQEVGSGCEDEDGTRGVCRKLEDCQGVQVGVERRTLSRGCWVRGAQPLVCCPLPKYSQPKAETNLLPGLGKACREQGWVCRRQEDCPGGKAVENNGWSPRRCGTWGGKQLVCCPPQPLPQQSNGPLPSDLEPNLQSTSGWVQPNRDPLYLKAERLCQEYGKYVKMKVKRPVHVLWAEEEGEDMEQTFCGREITPLITNGNDSNPREFPHMAQIGYGSSPAIDWRCGGSLISERYVLTAAHCTQPTGLGLARWVKLGELDSSTDKDDARPTVVEIADRLNHPDYQVDGVLYHDIALYRLKEKVQLSIYIRPICLATEPRVTERTAIASGWGHAYWRASSGNPMLQKVELRLVPNEVCRAYYNPQTYPVLPHGIHPDFMLCAGGHDGKDTCQGDSGGPLQVVRSEPYCTYTIIGITSFGSGCGTSTPGVYTNVAHYASWIQSVVWPT